MHSAYQRLMSVCVVEKTRMHMKTLSNLLLIASLFVVTSCDSGQTNDLSSAPEGTVPARSVAPESQEARRLLDAPLQPNAV